jgi:Holliday junction resolvase
MAHTPEGKVKAEVVKILRRHNAYYFFAAMNGYGRSGVPDIICCINGKFLAIECKAGTNETTALQDKEIFKIQTAKGHAIVAREANLDLVETVIKELSCVKGEMDTL